MKRVRSFTGCATLLLAVLSPLLTRHASAQESGQTGSGDPVEIVSLTSGRGKPVALDATGRFAAILAGGAAAELWDIKKGRLVRTFATPDISLPSALALSSDGSRIAVGGDGKAIVVWETRTGRIVATPASPIGLVETLAFSKDGRRLVYGGKAKVDIFKRIPAMAIQEIETGRIIKTIESTAFGTLATAYSPARDLVAVGGELSGAILILDIDGRVLRTWSAHKNAVHRLAFSPDGTRLASSELQSSLVHIWEVPEGRLLRTLPAQPSKWGVGALSWSPHGTSLATLDSDHLRIWDAVSGAIVASKPETDYVQDIFIDTVALAQDGASLLVGGVSSTLDAKSLDLKSRLGVLQFADLSVVLPQGMGGSKVVFNRSPERGISLWWLDLSSGATQNLFSDPGVNAGHFSKASSDGRHIVGANGEEVFYIDPSYTPPLKSFRHDGFLVGALSANGQVIALHLFSTDKDNSIRIVDGRSGRIVRVLKHARSFNGDPALSPDGQTLAVVETAEGNDKYTLHLWNVATGRKAHVKIDGATNMKPLAFAPDGRSLLIAGTSPHAYSVEHWSVAGPKLLARLHFPGEHDRNKADGRFGPLQYVASFHPDGKSAVIADDTVLRLWALDGPRVVQTYRGHTSRISAVTFAMHGRRIVSQAPDGLKVWDTATGALLATYWITAQNERVVITPEGFFDATEGGAKMLSVVRGLDAYSIDQVYQSLYRPDLVREKLAGDPTGKVKEAAARLDLSKVLASGAAPRVTIAAPANRTRSDTDEVAVEATIADQGGGIGRVEWRVNGVTLGLEERGLARVEGGTAPAETVRRTLSLEPGENRIEVVAYNGRNLIASEPARVTVSWDGERSVTPPKLHVLAVGVNDYWDSRLKLAYAVPDAKALGAALAKAGAGLYGEGGVKVTTLADEEVTIANLDKVFARTAKEVQPRDTFALFVAGHGKTLNGRYYFLPRDFRYDGEQSIEKAGVDQDRLQGWLAQIKARKTVLLIDTCESGSLTGDRLAVRGLERVAAFEKLTRAMGRTVLSASSDDAPALEGYRGHGAFTYVLLEALGAADINNNGLIEVGEIADYLEDKLPDLTFRTFKLRQVPHRKMVGNNFALAGKAVVLPAAGGPPPAVRPESAASKTPTHVVTATTPVRADASGTAAVVIELSPGMQVTLVETSGGWVLVARDGRRLGYVEEKALARLQ